MESSLSSGVGCLLVFVLVKFNWSTQEELFPLFLFFFFVFLLSHQRSDVRIYYEDVAHS